MNTEEYRCLICGVKIPYSSTSKGYTKYCFNCSSTQKCQSCDNFLSPSTFLKQIKDCWDCQQRKKAEFERRKAERELNAKSKPYVFENDKRKDFWSK